MTHRHTRFLVLLSVLVLSTLLAGGRPAFAAEPAKAGYFVHPDKLFSVALPPGVVRGRPERYRIGAPDLVVRSDDGFVLSVESRRIAMAGDAREVLEQLERLYLGQGRPWSRRVEVRPFDLGGLPGVRAVYDGVETDGIVAMARGRNTDFLIMFFTPKGLRDKLAAQFDWILERFDVAQSERRDRGSPLVRAPVFKAPGVFRHERLGYTVRYPETWIAAYDPPFSAVFAPGGTDGAIGVRVRIENVTVSSGDGVAVDTVLEQWRGALAAAADSVSFERPRPLAVQSPGGTRIGVSSLASYVHHGERSRQWVAILPRDDGATVHVWRYDAPEALFDRYRDQADSILRSLVMETPAPITPPGTGSRR